MDRALVRIGDVIADRFRVRSLAGSGGMGKVYRSVDERTGDEVAVKVLSLDAKKYSKRFLREAKVMAELSHPNIVGYVDYGETDRGAPYIVMEWVDGVDLRQRMNRKKLSLPEALQVIAGVGEALAYAHRRGVIHRDLKPSNLMLVGGDIGHLKLLDFGIARWRGPTVERMTRTGISIGTPGYMAPEQSRGESDIDGRADLYALGCVIYECLVGRRPFHGEDIVAVLARNAFDEPPRVSDEREDISSEFDDLLADMMATNAERRPADGAIMSSRASAIPSAERVQVRAQTGSQGLTSSEKELLSIILIEAPASPVQGAVSAAPESVLSDTVRRLGGKTQVLEDGTTVVTMRDESGSATNIAIGAVRCALALRKLCPESKISLATCQGDLAERRSLTKTIQNAAVLLHSAEPGGTSAEALERGRPLTVRLDETTYRLLDNRFDVRRRRNDASAGFDLLGERREGSGPHVQGKSQRCIGREAELERLVDVFEGCLDDGTSEGGTARAILVTGAPGVGKSRLCDEACSRIRKAHPTVEIWMARADSVAKGSAFRLLQQILRQATGLSYGDSVQACRDKITARVAEVIPSSDAMRVAEFLGELCGYPFPAHSTRTHLRAARGNAVLMGDQMRRAWEDFLAAVATKNPIILFLEDLHWGDLPTIRMIDGALRNSGSSQWMLLAVARPEIHSVFPKLWKDRGVERLELKGLSQSSCRAMAQSILGHACDEETVTRLIRLSGGNPFYLEELIQAIQLSHGEQIPGTVLAMAQARLHTLGSDARRVLRAGSVFGRVFWKGGVEELLGDAAQTIEVSKILRELVDTGFVRRDRTTSMSGQVQFSIRQDLMREAAYSTLTDTDRELGHRLAGQWLHNAGNREAFVLANHFQLGRQADKATEWYEQAARQALGGNDLGGAIRTAERGISSGAKGQTLGRLHATIARALLWTGENGKSSEHSMLAMEHFKSTSDDWAAAAGDCVTALGRCGAFADIVTLADTLLATKRVQALTGPVVAALARSSSRLLLAGRYEDAVRILRELPSDDQSSSGLDPSVRGHLMSALASRHLCEGNPGTYLRLSETSASHFEACGDRRSATITRVNVGFAYAQLGDYASAEVVLRAALDVALEMDLNAIGSLARNNLGRVLLSLGHLDEAWDLELIAIESFLIQGDERMANGSRVYLSQIHQRKGALQSAEKEAREALQGTSTVPSVRMQASAQLASVLLDLGRPEEALHHAKEAAAAMDSIAQVEEGESKVRLVLVEAHQQCMKLDEAKESLETAYASLLRRTNQIDDAHWRLSFVEQVEENARIVQLANEWGLDKTN